MLSEFLFQGYHLSRLASETWVSLVVNGADEKEEMGTDLYGTLTVFFFS